MILFKVTFYFICFCLVFHFATKSYLNPYKLIMVFGKKGAGKTTFLTKIAVRGIAKGRKIYSTCYIPGVEIFDPKQIGFRSFDPDSILLIDEVSLIWDNRNWKNMRPEVVKFFRYQRHYKLTVYMFSQSFDVDKKLRDLTDEMYLLRNRFRIFSVARRINKRITVSRPSEDQEGNGNTSGALIEDYSFAPIIFPGSMIWTFIPRWVIFFDSFEDDDHLDPVDTELIQLSGDQYQCVRNGGYRRYVFRSKIKAAKDKVLDTLRKIRIISKKNT